MIENRRNGEQRVRRALDCVWCGDHFPSIIDLLEHVEDRHLEIDGFAEVHAA